LSTRPSLTQRSKGIIITSGKKDFAGGMDLNVIAHARGRGTGDLRRGHADAQAVLRKIERAGMDPKTLKGGKPIVAALPGTALGIGLELPLSCHRIIAADNPRPKSACPKSWSASSPARAAPPGSRASWAR
jgi:3-hydroxyacyl-CoA dehydrogenase / enoyl-CoA hydratase / 3-hydroxybutyryl-CoA epimerase